MPTLQRTALVALLRDRRGNMATMVALMSTVLFGFGALAVDAGHLYVAKKQLQSTADAAALAAVMDLPDEVAAHTSAMNYANKNMAPSEYGSVLKSSDVTFGQWDADTRTFNAGVSPADAVRVTTRRAQANGNPAGTYLARVLGYNEVDVVAGSTAAVGKPPVCILALDPSASGAFNVGNGMLSANGCTVHVNSDHPTEALSGNSNGEISAASICVAGSHGDMPTYSPAPETGCPPLDDPLAYLEAPSFGSCDHNNFNWNGGDTTLNPGVYCGGMDLNAGSTITLTPGLYVVKDGVLKVAGSAVLIGSGVTIYVTGAGAGVDILGASSVTLSAPTTGPLAGILFFGDRDLVAGTEFALNGGPDFHYEGTIYVPTGEIRFNGSGTGTSPSPYTMIIALRFTFNGIGELVVNANYDGSTVPLPSGLGATTSRLVM